MSFPLKLSEIPITWGQRVKKKSILVLFLVLAVLVACLAKDELSVHDVIKVRILSLKKEAEKYL